MPVSLSYLSSVELNSMKFADPTRTNYFSSRLTYVSQILIARKFNDNFSFQITPTYIHRNLTKTELDKNDIFALGVGARYKLSKRLSLNAEYYYTLNPNAKYLDTRYYNSASVGIDIETGGHVFQIMLTNSQGGSIKEFISGSIYQGYSHFKNSTINEKDFLNADRAWSIVRRILPR